MNNIFEQWWIWWDVAKTQNKDPLEFFELHGQCDCEQLLLDHEEQEIIMIVAEKSHRISTKYQSAFFLIRDLYTTLSRTREELHRVELKHQQIVLKHLQRMVGRLSMRSYVESDISNTDTDEEVEAESN